MTSADENYVLFEHYFPSGTNGNGRKVKYQKPKLKKKTFANNKYGKFK